MYANMHDVDEEEEEEMDVYDEIDAAAPTTTTSSSSNGQIVNLGVTDDAEEDDDGDDEFIGIDEQDDETTMIEEEARGNEVKPEEEISMLQSEGEIPIEQLRAMYANMHDVDEEEEEEEEEEDMDVDHDSDDDDISAAVSSSSNNNIKLLLKDKENDVGSALQRLDAADQMARSIHVDRPFLLAKKLSLREYQHIGLNWLVSLHERRLNGILADEMGLGKTIQTIAMLAYLAAYRGLWGPHLIIVPTSCLVNWESEFKRFCPMFKVITYYGSAKARKNLRLGWSKINTFHVVITSYQLVVQDANVFRRKRWYYMILDEAHNIKNFKSQRWQTLLNFNTQRRLLLTGTPLQNNLMELWSLMHFLMPHVFRSRKEFSYWFSNPLNNMVEGNRDVNMDLIGRLHSIMRPFILRRLKKDVAKQLPGKFEHIVMCKLSKRQQFLYEEFMSRSTTRALLSGGNYMGMMNILMQLRKVCNHPDLFEPRPIESPYIVRDMTYNPGNLFLNVLNKGPLNQISSNLLMLWRDTADVTASLDQLCPDPVKLTFIDDVNLLPLSDKTSHLARHEGVKKLKNLLIQDRRHTSSRNALLSKNRCGTTCLRLPSKLFELLKVYTRMHQWHLSKTDVKYSRKFPTSLYTKLVLSMEERTAACNQLICDFVFVIPKIIGHGLKLISSQKSEDEARTDLGKRMKEPIQKAIDPLYDAMIRQRIHFPDRKLVQYDSGKLQTLAKLLRERKRGGHKCLIFTQMSKMLDILEIFLNLNGFTYVRLDGSTGVDKRQKLMDRFNSDDKLFCFILSTRSGGLGINLTGADTVVFYDSDWNPAMDAQAQDRAHRIGQTREVHIYRLVCQSTVEENILTKAKQKRHLDFLVMTEGNFDESSLLSNNNLQEMLGVDKANNTNEENEKEQNVQSVKQMEAAMAAAEDEEDLSAMKSAKAEKLQEAAEFDENAKPLVEAGDSKTEEEGTSVDTTQTEKKNSSSNSTKVKDITEDVANDEKDLEAEFASWQAKIGPDYDSLVNALKPVEKYALKVRTIIDPHYSMFFLTEQQRIDSMGDPTEQWDLDEIERTKEEEEIRALQEGELLSAEVQKRNISSLKRWLIRERSKRSRERTRRIMTGAGWSQVVDQVTGVPFWYNNDTGEASYSIPKVRREQELLQLARDGGYSELQKNIVELIFSFLVPFPGRAKASATCRRWRSVASGDSFHKRVLSVEICARDEQRAKQLGGDAADRTYASLEGALAECQPGDVISMGAGHHWEGSLTIAVPVRIIGPSDGNGCVIELTGTIQILPSAKNVTFANITLRRPRQLPAINACIYGIDCKLSLYSCSLNNDGAFGSVIFIGGENSELDLLSCTVTGGTAAGVTCTAGVMRISDCHILNNKGSGLIGLDTLIACEDTYFNDNKGGCIDLRGSDASASVSHCDFRGSTNLIHRPEQGFFGASMSEADTVLRKELSSYGWNGLKESKKLSQKSTVTPSGMNMIPPSQGNSKGNNNTLTTGPSCQVPPCEPQSNPQPPPPPSYMPPPQV